jgi:hypothetical protein
MSNKKQSSIDWLYSKMYEHRGNITIEEFEQAKAMHKKEIALAFNIGEHEGFIQKNARNGTEYYNETFGGQDERDRSIPE